MASRTLVAATTLAVATVATAASVSAVKCTPAQIAAINKIDYVSLFNACPAFAAAGAADPNDFKTWTDASLELISPCKEKPCLVALTKLVSDMPDCTGAMRNKFVLGVTRKVCEAFNAGPVAIEQVASIRQEEGEKAYLSMLEQDPGVDDGTLAWNDTGFTLKDTALYPDADMPADITTLSPVPCSSRPSPMTTPKSAASIATTAGVAAITIAFGLGILS